MIKLTFLYTTMLGSSSGVMHPFSIASDLDVGREEDTLEVAHWLPGSLDDMLAEIKKK